MIFEVDNTTEKLLKDMEGGIEDAISSLKTGNEEIAQEVAKLLKMCALLAKSGDVQQLCDDMGDVKKLCKAGATGKQVETVQKELDVSISAVEAAAIEIAEKQEAMLNEIKNVEACVKAMEKSVVASNKKTVEAIDALTKKMEKTDKFIDAMEAYLTAPRLRRKYERVDCE